MVRSNYQIGDVFLLFHQLPFEFDKDLPLNAGPNVYLDNTPQEILDSAEPPALSDFLIPGYNIPGMGLTQCCLRVSAVPKEKINLKAIELLFLSVLSLRLKAPIGIKIASQFEFGPEDTVINNPGSFELTSCWQPIASARYSGEDICSAAEIATHIMQIEKINPKRLMSAVVLFSHVTCGLSRSRQLSYLGLFSALEALFVPQGNKAKNLARRITSFLQDFDSDRSFENWLSHEYKQDRSKIAHGVQDIKIWGEKRLSKLKTFGKLHEITRLCILGFLSLEHEKLMCLSGKSGGKLQKELDNLGSATGKYLEGQSMWLG